MLNFIVYAFAVVGFLWFVVGLIVFFFEVAKGMRRD